MAISEAELNQTQMEHPCFNPKIIHKFGRVHLPVAPRCNIKCGYCDPKSSCLNESRPGLAFATLKPQQAIPYLETAVEKVKGLRVVGIAGPGDPLANKETFEVLRLIRQRFGERFILCLSTNGLFLPRKTEILAALGVKALTVTINAVDPAIGKKIYRHVLLAGRKLSGNEAAEALITRQLWGVAMASSIGIKIKVNSVLIPGVNSEHLPEIAKRVKKLGASTLNIIPLIPNSMMRDITTPNRRELEEARLACRPHIEIMEHCRQCRADAVGLLCDTL